MSILVRRRIAAIALASLSVGLLSCDHGPTSPAPSKSVSTPPSHPGISATWAGGVVEMPFGNLLLLDGGRDPGWDSYSGSGEFEKYVLTVVVDDDEGPLPGQNVQLYIPKSSYWGPTQGYDYIYCDDQSTGISEFPEPVHLPWIDADIFSLTTDEAGVAHFLIKGWNPPTSVGNNGPYNNWGKGQVWVNGEQTTLRFNVCTPNLDGAVGIGSGDLSHFITDFATGTYHARCDWDNTGPGGSGAGDLARWLTLFQYLGFQRNCN